MPVLLSHFTKTVERFITSTVWRAEKITKPIAVFSFQCVLKPVRFLISNSQIINRPPIYRRKYFHLILLACSTFEGETHKRLGEVQ